MEGSNAPSPILKLLSEDQLSISYRPALARLVGSVTGAILLQQVVHRWFAHGRKPFYKFKLPCRHKEYRPGDAWCEELAFTRHEFDGALAVIGTKVTQGGNKADLMAYAWPDLPEEASGPAFQAAWQGVIQHLVIYWTDSNRMTWYWLNETLLEKAIVETLSGKATFRLYLEKPKGALPGKAGKRRHLETPETGVTSKDSESGDSALDPESPAQTPAQTTPQTPSSTSGAPSSETSKKPANESGAIGDGDLEFILPEIRKLHLSQVAQKQLLGLGAQTALAIALASQGPGVRNPGGLAVTMMANGGPPELDLERAEIALEWHLLDREAIDEQLRKRECARIAEQMNDLVVQKAGQGDAPGAQASTDPEQPPPSSPAPDPPVDDTGLGYRPGSGRLTVRDLWVAALGELKLQLNRSTFENWVKGTRALSYADGVLTVQARHFMAHQMLTTRLDLSPTVSKMAGIPIQVRVVLAREGVGR